MIKVFKDNKELGKFFDGDFVVNSDKQCIHHRRMSAKDYYDGMPLIEWGNGHIAR